MLEAFENTQVPSISGILRKVRDYMQQAKINYTFCDHPALQNIFYRILILKLPAIPLHSDN